MVQSVYFPQELPEDLRVWTHFQSLSNFCQTRLQERNGLYLAIPAVEGRGEEGGEGERRGKREGEGRKRERRGGERGEGRKKERGGRGRGGSGTCKKDDVASCNMQ